MDSYDVNHSLEDIQTYHLLYGLVKTCTGNRLVMEKRNNFFRECRNVLVDTWKRLQEVVKYQRQRQWPLNNWIQCSVVQFIFRQRVVEHCTVSLTMYGKDHSLTGGGQVKYFTLSYAPCHSFHLVLTLNTALAAFQIDENLKGLDGKTWQI